MATRRPRASQQPTRAPNSPSGGGSACREVSLVPASLYLPLQRYVLLPCVLRLGTRAAPPVSPGPHVDRVPTPHSVTMVAVRGQKMLQYVNWRMRVTLVDSRQLVGTFMAFDKHMNLVLGDCEEYRMLPPPKGATEKREVKVRRSCDSGGAGEARGRRARGAA